MKTPLTKLEALAVAGIMTVLALGARAGGTGPTDIKWVSLNDANVLDAMGATNTTATVCVNDALAPAWVEGDAGREIALDTRARIVVADLNDIQPIAYSATNWGAYAEADHVSIYTNNYMGSSWLISDQDGYKAWKPQTGAYGKYDFKSIWHRGSTDYGTTNATVWYGQNYQFVFDEDQMIYVERPGDEHGLGNLEDVTSYTILNLKATPEYTNVDRYEFATWKAYSYAERDEGWKNPEECPQLAAAFGDIYAAETTFEMPFTNVFLTCSYQWKSNYNEVVSVEPGIYNAWEVHEGEVYKAGIATTNGSIVSFREKITTCFPVEVPLNLAAGATNIWDFTKGGRPCLEYFSRITAEEGAVKMVLFDETLTNDTYKIASHAESAVGQTFLISDGSSAKECTAVEQSALETAEWIYVGAKRFKLYVMTNNLLMFLVEDGSFAIAYDAMGGAWSDGTEVSNILTYVMTGYRLPQTNPARKGGYAFAGWTTEPEGAGVAVTNGMPLAQLAEHAVYATWKQGIAFDRTQYSVTEGGAVKVYVWGGALSNAVQATVTYQKNTGAYSAAYADGKRVSFPLTLSWAKGEYAAKEILFQTTASSRVDEDKSFTLQLGAQVGEAIIEDLEVCTVTIEDSGVATDNYARALAWPAHGGTVSGGGTLANERSCRTLTATTKNGSLLAGWYRAKADDPNVIDLREEARVAPYSERNPKQIRVGYDSKAGEIVNAAGTYFAYFTNVLEVAAVVEPEPFDEEGRTAEGVAGVTGWDAFGTYATMVGVKFALPVDFTDDSGKGRLTVSKLPSGLAYSANAGCISGIPTKAGTYVAQFVASNAAGTHTVTYTFVVDEIPALAVGTFAGVVSDDTNRTGVGSVQFTAGQTGSLSAKVVRRLSGARSFSVKGYDYLDKHTLGIAMTNGYGEVFEATLALTDGWYDTAVVGAAFGGAKRGTLGCNGETNGTFAAVRNAFSNTDKDPAAQQVLAAFQGTYAEALWATNGAGEAEAEVGTVQYRVNAQGSVYVVARLDKTYDGEKSVAAKTFSGTVTAGFTYDEERERGGVAAALRSGTSLWSTEAGLDYSTRAVTGWARYIRPNAEDKTETVDADEVVCDVLAD